MSSYYILCGDEVAPADLLAWARFLENGDRIIAKDDVRLPFWQRIGAFLLGQPMGYHVSTVFLGLDHRFGDEGPPLVFETMVFPTYASWQGWLYNYTSRFSNWSPWLDVDCLRCSTKAEALVQHRVLVEKWKKGG